MKDTSIPSWMLDTPDYKPARDHDGFMTQSLLKLMSVLSSVRDCSAQDDGMSAGMKLIAVLTMIILTAVSRNMFFTYCLIAGFLIRLLFVSGKIALRIMRSAISALLLSAVVLVPGIFLGSPRTLITVSLKVFLSVGMISLMSLTTPWNRLTAALKVFHIPDLMIFIFDLTIKYIAILGAISGQILIALKLRSVGKNRAKGKSVSGVLGVTFIRSRQLADAMFEAMSCRGFAGEYPKKQVRFIGLHDWPLVVVLGGVGALFIYTQITILR